MHDEDRLKEKLAKPGTPHMVRRHAAELCESRPSPTPARSGSSLRRPTSSPGRWETESPSTSYTRFAGSVFEEYLDRSPKKGRRDDQREDGPRRRAGLRVRGRGLRQSRPGNTVSETVSQY